MSKRILTFLTLISGQVFAQSSGSMLSTDLDTSRILERIKPDVISHFSVISGPGLGQNGNSFDETGTLSEEGSINGWHQVSIQYKLTDRTRFIINPRFSIDYNNRDINNGQPAAEGLNPVFGLLSTWYDNGRLSFAGGFNTILANVERDTIEDGLIANPGGFETLNFKINNRMSVGSWLFGRYNFATNADKDDDRFPVAAQPYFMYTFTDKFFIQPNFEYYGAVETSDSIRWDTDDRFNMQFSYTFNDYLTIQPIISVYRAQDYNLAKGNLNFWVYGTF